jgi:hypothetical protein
VTENLDARTAARQTAATNGWELNEGRGTDVFSRGTRLVAARWSAEGRLTNLGERDASDRAYAAVKGGKVALEGLLTAPAQQPARHLAAVPDQPAAEEQATPFKDNLGVVLVVGDRIMITAWGNNVRKLDVQQVGTVTGWSRTRVKVTWDATDDAPWKAILPELVQVLRRDGKDGFEGNAQ